MKKILLCLASILLIISIMCGCSTGTEETTVESTIAVPTAPQTTEPPVILKNWGPEFSADGTPQKVAYTFISSVFPETWRSLFSCDVVTKITKWGIDENSDEDNIRIYISFAVFATEPTENDLAILNAGNVQAGKDEYENAVILTRYLYLQRVYDSTWQCVGFDLSW